MEKPGKSTVEFLKTIKTCVEKAWEDTDIQYHIPKSHFQDERNPEPENEVSSSVLDEKGGKHPFKKFGNCFTSAWEAADKHYHIPKSRHGKVV